MTVGNGRVNLPVFGKDGLPPLASILYTFFLAFKIRHVTWALRYQITDLFWSHIGGGLFYFKRRCSHWAILGNPGRGKGENIGESSFWFFL